MHLPPDVVAAVRERLAPAEADAYLALARPSVGFTVAYDDDAGERGSVYGGVPRTGAIRWPMYGDEPMLLLAQIDCAEVAALLGPEWPFPADGFLLFFHDEAFSAAPGFSRGDDGCRVVHAPAGPPLDWFEFDYGPDEEDDDNNDNDEEVDEDDDEVDIVVIDALPLEPVPTLALPEFDAHASVAGLDAAIELSLAGDVHEAVRVLLPTPRHRLLGWCDTHTPHPADHRPLLQLEAEMGTAWGEVVNISFWISHDDFRAGRLDRVRRSYETA